MFTVKATYRGQTRKISFANVNAFPSFEELCNQLYRVFPISHNYYLSKLLFSPSNQASRILIAKEVHSADDYDQCVGPFLHQSWSNPLLRFAVYEETPHKAPGASSASSVRWSAYSTSDTVVDNDSSVSTILGYGIGLPSTSPAPNPVALPPPMPFMVPPPPIIYSSPPRAYTQAPMDVDQAPASQAYFPRPGALLSPSFHVPPPPPLPRAPSPQRCACVDGKKQIEDLLTSFKADLDNVLTATFGSSPSTRNAEVPRSPPVHVQQPVSPPKVQTTSLDQSWSCIAHWCDSCMKRFSGPWHACLKCPVIQCSGCQSAFPNGHMVCQFSSDSLHSFSKRTCPSCPRPWVSPQPWATWQPPVTEPASSTSSAFSTLPPLPNLPPPPLPPPGRLLGPGKPIQPWEHIYTPAPVSAFVPPSPSIASPRPVLDAPALPCVLPPVASPDAPVQEASTPAAAPVVVHEGIICDACSRTVEGIRHKCLDCPDYDLCTGCITSGSAERHNPFHEFFEISEPGRVIVHTVFSGQGERESTPSARAPPAAPPTVAPPPVAEEAFVHAANCDMCDSRIHGDRYKCLVCPDFDTCSSCFTIADDQHPQHSFVKITNPKQYIRRASSRQVTQVARHYATCDICKRGINGIRYKCMHFDCPDFDLCETCEALPIPVHPATHPLLKMRSVDTAIPTVYRASVRIPSRPASPALSYYDQVVSPRPIPAGVRLSQSPIPLPPSFSVAPPHYLAYSAPSSPERSHFSASPPSPRSPALSIPGGFDSPRLNAASPEPDLIANYNHNFTDGLSLDAYPTLSPSTPPVTTRDPAPQFVKQEDETPSLPASFVPQVPAINTPEPVSNASSGRATPDHKTSSEASAASEGSSATFRLPPLSLDNGSDLLREFWPRVAQEFNHLLSLQTDNAAQVPTPNTSTESPLTGEALLSRPLPFAVPRHVLSTPVVSANALSSLAALLNVDVTQHRAPSPIKEAPPKSPIVKLPKSEDTPLNLPAVPVVNLPPSISPPVAPRTVIPIPEPPVVLHATFIEDITVPDGQVFPPGAEFVKTWKMLNDSDKSWPENTELVYVAGDTLSRGALTPKSVGFVAGNAEVELSTGELKAPDTPGRYVSYWRLRAGNGGLFGDSIWIDITVQEPSRRSTSDFSPSSSIIVPSKAQTASEAGTQPMPMTEQNLSSMPSSASISTPSEPSLASTNPDVASDAGSVGSDVSLISVPSSGAPDFDDEEDEEDEAVVWEDSRSHFSNERPPANTENIEYVLLFDDNSSEEGL
ncbi:hypothetical protein EYR36_007782 [Pleurotus pulmonarius]|nr:hypothetical protein EYR36_007782 [Pleurotus pulmonarius]